MVELICSLSDYIHCTGQAMNMRYVDIGHSLAGHDVHVVNILLCWGIHDSPQSN